MFTCGFCDLFCFGRTNGATNASNDTSTNAWPHNGMAAQPHGRTTAWPHNRMAAQLHARSNSRPCPRVLTSSRPRTFVAGLSWTELGRT